MADRTVLDEIAAERRVFPQDGLWEAANAAEAWLVRGGYSVGRGQRGAPRGILRGDFDIQKWRNLRPHERKALDGVMTGDGRHGPIVVTLYGPDAASEIERLDRAAQETPDAG